MQYYNKITSNRQNQVYAQIKLKNTSSMIKHLNKISNAKECLHRFYTKLFEFSKKEREYKDVNEEEKATKSKRIAAQQAQN